MITKTQLAKLDMAELRSIRDLIQREIEYRAEDVKYDLRPGTKVKINHKKTIGKIFTVVNVKHKKALVEDLLKMRYNVSIPLLEIVK